MKQPDINTIYQLVRNNIQLIVYILGFVGLLFTNQSRLDSLEVRASDNEQNHVNLSKVLDSMEKSLVKLTSDSEYSVKALDEVKSDIGELNRYLLEHK